MAKLKATPKNFAEAVAVLKDKISVRLGNNTYLEVSDSDPLRGFIGVRLHNTFVVKFWPDGQVTLHTGGYRTTTTKERINQFVRGRVWQAKGEWWYHESPVNERPFSDMSPKIYREQSRLFVEGMDVS